MSEDIEEEVDESFEDFDDNFEPDLETDLEIDEFEEDAPFKDNSNDDITKTEYKGAVRANPKRMNAAQRKKAASIIEGIISDAELSEPGGQTKAWQKLHAKTDVKHAKAYDIKAPLTENDVVDHPRFGVGFVVQLLSPTKVEVLFESGVKRLICNQNR